MSVSAAQYTSDDLERMANEYLAGELKDKRSNKARTSEYPILSEDQLRRRRSQEVPFTALGVIDKVSLGLRTDD